MVSSPAFKKNGLLVITFDEGSHDSAAWCGEHEMTDGPAPGLDGPGGGRIGALLIGPSINPGAISGVPYSHYALLCWTENNFGLGRLGYAAALGLATFGSDVFAKS